MFDWLVWIYGAGIAVSGYKAFRTGQPALILTALILALDFVGSWLIHRWCWPPSRFGWQAGLDFTILSIWAVNRRKYQPFPKFEALIPSAYFTLIALNAIILATGGRAEPLCTVGKDAIVAIVIIALWWISSNYARVAGLESVDGHRHRLDAHQRGHTVEDR